MPDNIANVTRSPSEDAIGVAMLSGFNFSLLDIIIMNMITAPSNRLAKEAVATLVPTITIKRLVSRRFDFDIS